MKANKPNDSSRRDFLKKACGAGVGIASGVAGLDRAWARTGDVADADPAAMPQRPFGKTGVQVPILGLGGSQNLMNRQLLLAQALKMGVSYWDTSDNYSGGRSEAGIGAFFSKHPHDRKRVFLVTKTSSSSPRGMDASLAESLERLKTDYVDLFFLHGLSRVEGEVGASVREWAENAKADGRIRFFGFSTHRNMAACLSQAARLGWLDGIMMTYNYRLMQDAEMREAVNDCTKAGIGLIAMKTQGPSLYFGGKESMQRFIDRGMNKYQARLKAVWENPQIASICSHMDSLAILKENVAAAVDGSALSGRDRDALAQHARRTAAAYCTGCGDVCESLIDDAVPVADVMRCLMYAHRYNDYQMARDAMARLPADIRDRLLRADYARAESQCPQRMAIGTLMRRAADELG
ncbi:MAG: aldo/keto reductase [Desulfobacterales bacterium]|nr:aldo/keto reductase [Desulfobacterales bacterium]MDJ0856774.1 aldo/keto reductase [Desulfobacterales bacterium]